MEFSEEDKVILHSYVENNNVNKIIEYIESVFGSETTRNLIEKNAENEKFDEDELLNKIKDIIKINNDDPDNTSFEELVNELQIVYTDHNYWRGYEDEMIYSEKKVTFILKNLPNIIYEKFNKEHNRYSTTNDLDAYSTITEYIIYNNDLENLKLVEEILNKNNKTFIDVVNSDLHIIFTSSKSLIKYIMKNLKKDPNYSIDNLIESIKNSDNYSFTNEHIEADEFIEYIKSIYKN